MLKNCEAHSSRILEKWEYYSAYTRGQSREADISLDYLEAWQFSQLCLCGLAIQRGPDAKLLRPLRTGSSGGSGSHLIVRCLLLHEALTAGALGLPVFMSTVDVANLGAFEVQEDFREAGSVVPCQSFTSGH